MVMIPTVVLSHCFFFLTSYFLYKQPCFGLNRRTQVSAWFCSTQKSMAMGIPLIKIIFEGSPEIGLIQIPLLIYHPTQTIGASFFLSKMNKWVKKDDEEDKEDTRLIGGGNQENNDEPDKVVISSSDSYISEDSISNVPDDSTSDVPQTPEPSSSRD